MLNRRGWLITAAPLALRGQGRGSTMFGDAQAYERFMGRWSSQLAPLLVRFAALPTSGRVLDVGSGTGALAFSLAETFPNLHVLGIDPAAEYVAYANSRNPYPGRATFETGDAQHLRHASGSFDHCLSLLVVNFIPDRAKALAELKRVTRPGGSVSAAVWDYPDGMRMLRHFWDAAVAIDPSAARRDESHMPLCRSGELGGFWRKAGLTGVSETALDLAMKFASFADYWDPFLLGQGPAGAYLRSAGSHREAIRDELKRRLRVEAEEKPFTLAARAWAVRGIVARA